MVGDGAAEVALVDLGNGFRCRRRIFSSLPNATNSFANAGQGRGRPRRRRRPSIPDMLAVGRALPAPTGARIEWHQGDAENWNRRMRHSTWSSANKGCSSFRTVRLRCERYVGCLRDVAEQLSDAKEERLIIAPDECARTITSRRVEPAWTQGVVEASYAEKGWIAAPRACRCYVGPAACTIASP
jgi:hypothetical protein